MDIAVLEEYRKLDNDTIKSYIKKYEEVYSQHELSIASYDNLKNTIKAISDKIYDLFKSLKEHNITISIYSNIIFTYYGKITDVLPEIIPINIRLYDNENKHVTFDIFKAMYHMEYGGLYITKNFSCKIDKEDKYSKLLSDILKNKEIEENFMKYINLNNELAECGKREDELKIIEDKILFDIKCEVFISNLSENLIYFYGGIKFKISKIDKSKNHIFSEKLSGIFLNGSKFSKLELLQQKGTFRIVDFYNFYNYNYIVFDDTSKRSILLNDLIKKV